jgi:hypothetical protein
VYCALQRLGRYIDAHARTRVEIHREELELGVFRDVGFECVFE